MFIKRILNYTKIFICFAVSSLLLLSSSYSFVPNQNYTVISGSSSPSTVSYSNMNNSFSSGVTFLQLSNAIYGYYLGNTVTQEEFETVISSVETTHNICIWSYSTSVFYCVYLKNQGIDLIHYVVRC